MSECHKFKVKIGREFSDLNSMVVSCQNCNEKWIFDFGNMDQVSKLAEILSNQNCHRHLTLHKILEQYTMGEHTSTTLKNLIRYLVQKGM